MTTPNYMKYWWFDPVTKNTYEVDRDRWGKDFSNRDRVLAKTDVGDYEVSTVFLGIDHSHSPDGPPILWETMVFGEDAEYQERYPTYADAARGHVEVVKKLMIGEEL
jgi:hypothetical protein